MCRQNGRVACVVHLLSFHLTAPILHDYDADLDIVFHDLLFIRGMCLRRMLDTWMVYFHIAHYLRPHHAGALLVACRCASSCMASQTTTTPP
jgi:hypothetical protein